VSLEQPATERALQVADAFGQGRLGDVKLVRGLPEAGAADDFLKMPELTQFHAAHASSKKA
jgi:hypothetical protein